MEKGEKRGSERVGGDRKQILRKSGIREGERE